MSSNANAYHPNNNDTSAFENVPIFCNRTFVRGVRCVLRTAHVCVSLKLSMWNDEKKS